MAYLGTPFVCPDIGTAVGESIAPEIQAPIVRNNAPTVNTGRVRCQPISKQRFSGPHINTASSLTRCFKQGIGHNGIPIRLMRRDIKIEVVVELHVDPSAIFPPASLALKIEYVVFKYGIQRSTILTKNLDIKVLTHVVGIVVDIDMVCRSLTFEAIEVNAFPIVLADIVAYKDITGRPFHDAAKPEIIVTIVILNIGMGAVIVRIKGAPVFSTFSDISVYFVILDLDTSSVKAEDAVTRAVTAAVGQDIVLIYSILADTRYDAVSARMVYEITSHIDLGPEIVFASIPCLSTEKYPRVRGIIANPDSSDSLDPVANNTNIMKSRRLLSLHVDMNAPPPFTGYFPVDIMDVAVGHMDMVVRPACVPGQHIDAKQCPLIPVCPVCVGNLNPINFPEFHILQENAGRIFPRRINDWSIALAVGPEADGGILGSVAFGRKHAVKGGSPLKENSVTRPKFSVFVEIEISLRINAIHRRVHRRSHHNHQQSNTHVQAGVHSILLHYVLPPIKECAVQQSSPELPQTNPAIPLLRAEPNASNLSRTLLLLP